MTIGLEEFKCASRFLSQPGHPFDGETLFHRCIARPVSLRGERDLGTPHRVPLYAPKAMVVGRFLCFAWPSMPRNLRAW